MGKRTRVFNIPDDLASMQALGFAKARWTRKTIERRLDYLENCSAIGVIPDARGRRLGQRNGRTEWECITTPDDLADDMEKLREVVAAVRRCLASEGLDAAAERMGGIETMVRDMCFRLARDWQQRMSDAGRKGVETRRDNFEQQRLKVLAEMQRLIDQGRNVKDAAEATARRGIGTSGGANRQLWYRKESCNTPP